MGASRNRLQSTISGRAVGIILSSVLGVALVVELGAYEVGVRAEARATAQRKWSNQYCLSCHSDQKMIGLMMYKDDNNGTAALCTGARLPTAEEMRKVAAQFNGPPIPKGSVARVPAYQVSSGGPK